MRGRGEEGPPTSITSSSKLAGPAAHDEHDNDPAFKAYGEKAEAFQPKGPSVWGGTTIFEI